MNRIKELRERMGLQQKDLSVDLGISQPTISDWETGRKVPSAKNTVRLAEYFNVSVDYILGREEQKNEPATPKGDGLSESDKELMRRLMALKPEHVELVRAIVRALQEGK